MLDLYSALLHGFSTPTTQSDHVVVFIRKPPLTVYSPQGCEIYVTLIQQISPFALLDSFSVRAETSFCCRVPRGMDMT